MLIGPSEQGVSWNKDDLDTLMRHSVTEGRSTSHKNSGAFVIKNFWGLSASKHIFS